MNEGAVASSSPRNAALTMIKRCGKQKRKTYKSKGYFVKSGRQDLNLRPSAPKTDALAKLSYAPDCSLICHLFYPDCQPSAKSAANKPSSF